MAPGLFYASDHAKMSQLVNRVVSASPLDVRTDLAVLQRRLDDPRIAVGPVIAAASDQADAIAVALPA